MPKRKKIKRILLGLLATLLLLVAWQWPLVRYGLLQGQGQLKVMRGAQPVEQFMADPNFPDSLKQKLTLIQQVRQYAVDSLGIVNSENYTTLYDQGGKPILWVVTAAPPYSLVPQRWNFPIIGSFGYKGFFDLEKAKGEEARWRAQGYDTNIRVVNGWSTLGWFKDPILSNMLGRSDGDLAELIIHELTHATLYVKDNVTFNENLATFIGERGAERFLIHHYGDSSVQYRNYVEAQHDGDLFARHVLQGAKALEQLYAHYPQGLADTVKAKQKQALINEIISTVDTVGLYNGPGYQRYLKRKNPNNTFFLGYLRYRKDQSEFQQTLDRDFEGSLAAYLSHLKAKYPSL